MSCPLGAPRPRAARLPFALLSFVMLASSPVTRAAEAPPAVSGSVTVRGGGPLEGAIVRIVDHGLQVTTGSDGAFRFDAVPAGRHVLTAEHLGHAPAARGIDVVSGKPLVVDIALEPFHVEETVVISAAAGARSSDEMVQPASSISGIDLLAEARPSLGDALEALPGVSSTSFGPGASRPIIRGLGGDRVRIMTNGIEAGDASSASPDHAVATEVLSAERIEVLRGPATLRWGSNAIGGIVNVLDNRLPTQLPEAPVTGVASVSGGTNADELSGSVALDGAAQRLAWHLDGFARDASDIETPLGRLVNSWAEGSGATAGLAWVGERGRLAASYGGIDTEYGSPVEEEISIDLRQRRWDVEGEVIRREGAFRGLTVRAGGSDYEHVELEGDEVGTRFLSDVVEARIESRHAIAGRHEGAIGAQWTDRDFAAIGDESFVPPSQTTTLGVLVFQEARLSDNWSLQAGARWDARTTEAEGGAPDRDFGGLSASLGIVRAAETGVGFSASISRSVKLPSAEELYSDGPHAATGSYEIGDPFLDEEVGLGLDVGLRKKAEWWSVQLSLFAQSFDGFIRETPTGEVEDDLPVYRFLQDDAEFRGGELSAEIGLNRNERHHLRLQASAEYVRADSEGEDLPRIPPLTTTLGLRYDGPRAWAVLRGIWADSQDRVAPFETPTEGFEMLDAQVGMRFVVRESAHDVVLSLTNVTDELGRRHASFTKDVAPLPGRGASLVYRIVF